MSFLLLMCVESEVRRADDRDDHSHRVLDKPANLGPFKMFRESTEQQYAVPINIIERAHRQMRRETVAGHVQAKKRFFAR